MEMKEKLTAMLTKKLGLDLNPGQIQLNQSIQDLGVDSLVLVKLLYLLEDDYGVSLKTEEILAVNTFGDLLDVLEAKLAGQSVQL